MTFAFVAHHVVRGVRECGTRGYGQDFLGVPVPEKHPHIPPLECTFPRGTALSSVS